jgi:citrate synthase
VNAALSAGPGRAAQTDATARALLVALGARTTSSSVEAMTEALVLSADHELNVSTFAARVASSSGASLAASIVAALAALSGPLHGAATARVDALVAEIDRPERAAEVVAARLNRGESVPGFGHPLYPEGDPRGSRLLETAQRLSSKARTVRVLVSVTNAMHLVARERPTVDVGLTALAGALSLPRGAPLAIFACGRLAGWIAHVIEQRSAGHLVRPRALRGCLTRKAIATPPPLERCPRPRGPRARLPAKRSSLAWTLASARRFGRGGAMRGLFARC